MNLRSLVYSIDSIGLDDLNSHAALLTRVEEKYIFHERNLIPILLQLKKSCKLLEIGCCRNFRYESLYMDTEDLQMYRAHQNGKLNRYKIRRRAYVDSKLKYWEIKFKNNRMETQKKRSPMGENLKGFIAKHSQYQLNQLVGQIHVGYERMTLAHKREEIRITLDRNLSYRRGNEIWRPAELVILEIKRPRSMVDHPFRHILKNPEFIQTGFSKYCLGIGNFYPKLKPNQHKVKIQKLNSIYKNPTSGGPYYVSQSA